MDPQTQPGCAAGEQDGAGLVLGEGIRAVRFAEDVDPSGVRVGLGEHRTGHQVDVCVAAGAVLGRDDVAAEEGDLVGHLAGEAQQSGLGGRRRARSPTSPRRRRCPARASRRPGPPAAGAARRRRPPESRRQCWRSRRRRMPRRSSGRRTRHCGRRRRPDGCDCRRRRGRPLGHPRSRWRSASGRGRGGAADPEHLVVGAEHEGRVVEGADARPRRPDAPGPSCVSSPMPVTRVVAVAVTVRPAARRTRRGTAALPGRAAGARRGRRRPGRR